MRVMIVEDEKEICDTVAKRLYDMGYEVDTCYDGNAALEYVLAENYDLIVLDLNLPGRDGMDILRELRRKDEETKPASWQDRILNRITSYLQPKFFLLLAGIIVCLVSLTLNIRFAERMQELQDNDIKYRYLLMKGKAEGSDINLLEMNFSRERDNAFIKILTDSVIGFEYRSRKQAETLERARLLNERAEQLRKKADKLGNP